MKDTGPGPGIYEDVPMEEYLSWPYVSNSLLRHGERSMAHLKAAAEQETEPTPAMRLGSFLHAGRLEPQAILGRYVVMPAFEEQVRRDDGSEFANPKASKAYKTLVAEFQRVNAGKEIVSQEQYDKLLGVCRALEANERAREWLSTGGPTEVSIVWDDSITGVRCKGRIDKLIIDDLIVDLKTTADASRAESTIAKFGYHRQMAMYADGLLRLSGWNYRAALIFVETEPPFGVRSAVLSDDAMNWGRESYRRLLREYAACVESGEWPCYEDPDYWHLPPWATADHLAEGPVGLIVNEQTAVL